MDETRPLDQSSRGDVCDAPRPCAKSWVAGSSSRQPWLRRQCLRPSAPERRNGSGISPGRPILQTEPEVNKYICGEHSVFLLVSAKEPVTLQEAKMLICRPSSSGRNPNLAFKELDVALLSEDQKEAKKEKDDWKPGGKRRRVPELPSAPPLV